jgi:hypothetical protein
VPELADIGIYAHHPRQMSVFRLLLIRCEETHVARLDEPDVEGCLFESKISGGLFASPGGGRMSSVSSGRR